MDAVRSLIRRTAVWDGLLLLVIFLGGQRIGSQYIEEFQKSAHGDFGQPEFAAAVMSACGRGFVDPTERLQVLVDFLNVRTDGFSCDKLPAALPAGPPNFTQKLYRYLMTAVAWQWRWSGLRWTALTPLFGMMFATTLCAAYGLFRLAGGPLVGALGVIPLMVSAHHLAYLPQLRDYAKAPFILALVLTTASLARPPLRPRRTLLLAAAFGIVLGIGFGFRNDLLINIPPFLAVVLLLLPGRWRDNLKLKGASLLVATVLFVVSAWPILAAYRSGSNTGHVVVLGLMSTFDEPMAVTRPAYDLGSRYLDAYAATVINAHSRLHTGKFVGDMSSPEYDPAALGLLADVARHWPADIFIRGVASAVEVLNFPFTVGRHTPGTPAGLTAPWTLHFYERQADFLRPFAGMGPVLAFIAVLIVGAADVYAGLGLFLLIIYYCGYPAVQFHSRHFFHLEVMAWWALAFVVAAPCRVVYRAVADRRVPRPTMAGARRCLATGVIAALLVVVPAATLRAYQQRHVVSLIEGYLALPRTPLALSVSPAPAGTLVAPEGLWKNRNPSDPVNAEYVVAEFRAEDCDAASLPVTTQYQSTMPDSDYSATTRVAIAPAPTFRLVPAYYSAASGSHFLGFVLPAGYERCLTSVSRINDPARVPVLVELNLPPDWRDANLFQRLVKWESGPSRVTPLASTVPGDLVDVLPTRTAVLAHLTADQVSPGVAVNSTAHTWFTQGPVRADVAEQVWLQFPAIRLDAGAVLRARGVVRRGGIRVATTQDSHRIDSRAMLTPGPFRMLIAAPGAGEFGVRVTDEGAADWRHEPQSLMRALVSMAAPWMLTDDFQIEELAWVKNSR